MDQNILAQLELSLTAMLDRVIQNAAVSGVPAAGETVAGIAKLINNLSSNDATASLSAQQGTVLKGLIDTINGKLANPDPTIQSLSDVSSVLAQVNSSLANKVDQVAGKGLSQNDYITADKDRVEYLNPNRYERVVFQAADPGSNITNVTLVTNLTTTSYGGYDLHIDVFNEWYTSANRIRLTFYIWTDGINTYHAMVTGRAGLMVRLAVRADGRIVIHLVIGETYYPTVRVFAIPGPGGIFPSVQIYDDLIDTAIFNDPNVNSYNVRPPTSHNTTLHTGNVVGNVDSTSTAIIQMGSGINGSFIRLAGGLQICWHRSIYSYGHNTSDYGAHYSASIGWTFPAAFASIPNTWYAPGEHDYAGGTPTWAISAGRLTMGSPTTVNDFPIYILFSQPGGFTYRLWCFAIGSWS